LVGRVFKHQVLEQSLVLGAIARLIREAGIFRHTKCEKRRNVVSDVDYLAAATLSMDLESKADESHAGCPFLKDNSCSLIRDGLTVPTLCVKRIVAENSVLSHVKAKLKVASHFLSQSIKLVGAKL
jgi:hypothetical protein